MIGKELLSEVLGYDADPLMVIEVKGDGIYSPGINIYELAHKCKEWAFNQQEFLSTGKDIDGWFCLNRMNKKAWIEDTEPEAIFKACEWILEQKATS